MIPEKEVTGLNGRLELLDGKRRWGYGVMRVGIVCLAVFVLICVFDVLTGCGAAWAAAEEFKGDVTVLFDMFRGMIRLARITMMFVAALLGIICGVMWYTGQQQAQGMLQKFFVAVFFIFGATAILDAILGVTMGDIIVGEQKNIGDAENENW